MKTVGTFEAKTHLSALLDAVAKGERIRITRHGEPVAMLVPAEPGEERSREEAIRKLEAFGAGRPLKGITIRELISEGRRH